MRKLILILILFSITCQSQSVWQKIPDDVKHHYAGVFATVASGLVLRKLIKKNGFAIIGGLTTGILTGIAKEEVYDRSLKKGVPTNQDKLDTSWGAFCGTAYLGVGIFIHEDKHGCIDKRYWNDLAPKKLLIDTL